MKKIPRLLQFLVAVVFASTTVAFAHSGGTDSSGGHNDRKRGGYHYHHGMSAHNHPGGVCPYVPKRSNQSSASSVESAQKQELTHWITYSSRKRHNSSCRYYQNSKGRAASSTEGIACKICGG